MGGSEGCVKTARGNRERKVWCKNLCSNGDPKGLDPYKWDILEVNDQLGRVFAKDRGWDFFFGDFIPGRDLAGADLRLWDTFSFRCRDASPIRFISEGAYLEGRRLESFG